MLSTLFAFLYSIIASLYLVAEYFYSKNEKEKAKEFFTEIINLEDSSNDIKLQAQKRLNRDLSD